MPKKTSRNIIIVSSIIAITLLLIATIFFFARQTIIPELDNRIIYVDKNHLGSQFAPIVSTQEEDYENDKFYCEGRRHFDSLSVNANRCGGGGGIKCVTKKDFSRLKTFIRMAGAENGRMFFQNDEMSPLSNVMSNYEFIPDNLNKGVYDVFVNGE